MLYADTAETSSVGTETGIFDTEEMVSFYITIAPDAVVAEKHNKFTAEQFEKSISENIAQKHGAGMFIISLHDGQPNQQGEQIPPPPPMSQEIIGLKPFVVRRVASVKAQLSGEKEGYIIKHGQFPQEMR